MPQFISLSRFKSLYPDHSQLLTEKGFALFYEKLNGPEGKRLAEENGISHFNFLQFIESLNNPKNIVFHGWIEQNHELTQLLEGKAILKAFEDKRSLLKHRWADEFKAFISPYVVERLLKDSTEDIQQIAVLLSYIDLVVEDDKAAVEGELFKPIQRQLATIQHAEVIAEEKALIEFITPLCSHEIIVSVNHLSKGSYDLKLGYVDSILEAIKSKGCTVRFANWILKKMEELDLNTEHNKKLHSLRSELKTGNLRVRNHGEGRTPFRWKTSVGLLFICLIAFSIFYIIKYKPFNTVEDQEFKENASFKKFTIEKRMTIDSLLNMMEEESFTEEFGKDPELGDEIRTVIHSQTEYENILMRRIFNDLSKDATLKDHYSADSCGSPMPFKLYSGTKNLPTKTGSIESTIKNSSEYEIIVFVTTNNANGKVYSTLLKQNESMNFKMNQGDLLTIVAGNAYRKFDIPSGAEEDELPSIQFDHHFCDTDANYFESFNSPLKLAHTAKAKAKFLIQGKRNGTFEVVDVYNVTEDY